MTEMKTTRQTTVRTAQPGEFLDWEDEVSGPSTSLARHQPTFVPAAGSAQLPTVRLADPSVSIAAQLPSPAVVATEVTGTHVDRADAWLRYATPLSLAFAVVSLIAAVTFWQVPLLSWSALLIFTGMFFACYAFLFWRYLKASPEGIALLHTTELWGYLRREQAHRHSIERQMFEAHQRRTGGRQ
jgi:hypothetical protein